VLGVGTPHDAPRNRAAEDHEAQAVCDGQPQQPGIGDLAVAEQPIGVEALGVEQAGRLGATSSSAIGTLTSSKARVVRRTRPAACGSTRS
jgi:hypothetical protein